MMLIVIFFVIVLILAFLSTLDWGNFFLNLIILLFYGDGTKNDSVDKFTNHSNTDNEMLSMSISNNEVTTPRTEDLEKYNFKDLSMNFSDNDIHNAKYLFFEYFTKKSLNHEIISFDRYDLDYRLAEDTYYGPSFKGYFNDFFAMQYCDYAIQKNKGNLSDHYIDDLWGNALFVFKNYKDLLSLDDFYRFLGIIINDLKNHKKYYDMRNEFRNLLINDINNGTFKSITPNMIINYLFLDKSDDIPAKFVSDTLNVKSYLTSFGKDNYDDIYKLFCEELESIYKKTGINYFWELNYVEYKEEHYQFLYFYTYLLVFKDMQKKIKLVPKEQWPKRLHVLSSPIESKIKSIVRKCENDYRKSLELPEVGESWLSETVLYKQIETVFYDEEVLFHASPDFLGRQHYDIYLPKYKIAIEYQGEQHSKAIDFFGGEEGLRNTVERDKRKKIISDNNAVTLLYVYPYESINPLIKKLSELISRPDYYLFYIKEGQLDLDKEKDVLRNKIDKLNLNTKKKPKISKEKIKEMRIEGLRKLQNQRDGSFYNELRYFGHIVSHYNYLDVSEENVETIIKDTLGLIDSKWILSYRGLKFEERKSGLRVYYKAFSINEISCDFLNRAVYFYERRKKYKQALDIINFGNNTKLFQFREQTVNKFEKKKERIIIKCNVI